MASRLSAAVRGEREGQPGLEQLTAREREVLLGIAQGRTNKEIATELTSVTARWRPTGKVSCGSYRFEPWRSSPGLPLGAGILRA